VSQAAAGLSKYHFRDRTLRPSLDCDAVNGDSVRFPPAPTIPPTAYFVLFGPAAAAMLERGAGCGCLAARYCGQITQEPLAADMEPAIRGGQAEIDALRSACRLAPARNRLSRTPRRRRQASGGQDHYPNT
jgi:hypothetical protein